MADLRIPDINSVFLAGRLTQDPDLRYTASNKAMCRLRLAVSRFYRTSDGERREDTLFVSVTCWEKQAEFVNDKLRKGRPVYVEGRLRSFDVDDRDTGQKRTMVEVQAQRIQQLDWDEQQGGGAPSRSGGADSYGGRDQSGGRDQGGGGRPRPIEEPIPDDDIPF